MAAQPLTVANPHLTAKNAAKNSRFTVKKVIVLSAPLNASASQAGALISNSQFEVPQFQREYSWQQGEVSEFWNDLKNNLETGEYFLGLIILTDENGRKQVVDGQQRLVTLTLLATALFYAAKRLNRQALSDRIEADFLRAINYETDEKDPRVFLADPEDNLTLTTILNTGVAPRLQDSGSVSYRIAQSYSYLATQLETDLQPDAFKRLGKWADFLTNQLYFAVFVHPDQASAYQVFEVVNTRGRELTTADLLKNYVLSQTVPQERNAMYETWRGMSSAFSVNGSSSTFVQFIRHAVTSEFGHVLPRDLYSFLSGKKTQASRERPSPPELMELLERQFPLYMQMVDTSSSGPATGMPLQVFGALNDLNVLAVRPILLALFHLQGAEQGMEFLLRLVVRRIVVGNLGTGNVERMFGEAAKVAFQTKNWQSITDALGNLNPSKEEFTERLAKRSYNKGILTFLKRSIVQNTITPESVGNLHLIWPRNTTADWPGFLDEDTYWSATIGNTFLANAARRPLGASDSFEGFKNTLLKDGVENEFERKLNSVDSWNASKVETFGEELAAIAADIWY